MNDSSALGGASPSAETASRDSDERTAVSSSRAASHAGRAVTVKRILREPLLHFLLLGALLFALDAWLHPQDVRVQSHRIVLTQDDLRQLAVQWLAQGRALPTPKELQSLVDQRVSEEILFREALNLGLDKDDEIIKRRLAQKM